MQRILNSLSYLQTLIVFRVSIIIQLPRNAMIVQLDVIYVKIQSNILLFYY